MQASTLLRDYCTELALASRAGPILDLACGKGRNGLYLLHKSIPVVFADRDPRALSHIQAHLDREPGQAGAQLAHLWQIDLEQAGADPLSGEEFGGILVFRYLHRPLLAGIKQAVCQSGLLIYETFTVDQASFGRPTNPDFLLHHGELQACFADWTILHSFEGIVGNSAGHGRQAVAQIVARNTWSPRS